MSRRLLPAVLAIALGLSGGMAAKWLYLSTSQPPEPAMEIAWSALVPLGATPKRTAGPGRRTPSLHDAPVADDRAFMSEPLPRPPADAPLVDDLDGRRVAIRGYAVPLDVAARRITEFLLVPYVGACIHVPPPPANQIVYVLVPAGIEIAAPFDPVTVTGRITADRATTALADVGYRIDDARVAVTSR